MTPSPQIRDVWVDGVPADRAAAPTRPASVRIFVAGLSRPTVVVLTSTGFSLARNVFRLNGPAAGASLGVVATPYRPGAAWLRVELLDPSDRPLTSARTFTLPDPETRP